MTTTVSRKCSVKIDLLICFSCEKHATQFSVCCSSNVQNVFNVVRIAVCGSISSFFFLFCSSNTSIRNTGVLFCFLFVLKDKHSVDGLWYNGEWNDETQDEFIFCLMIRLNIVYTVFIEFLIKGVLIMFNGQHRITW